ncbi:hypothetical protein ACFQX4_25445 [Roseomonas sp. GCM10028921]
MTKRLELGDLLAVWEGHQGGECLSSCSRGDCLGLLLESGDWIEDAATEPHREGERDSRDGRPASQQG